VCCVTCHLPVLWQPGATHMVCCRQALVLMLNWHWLYTGECPQAYLAMSALLVHGVTCLTFALHVASCGLHSPASESAMCAALYGVHVNAGKHTLP
jgi:hypothetical protein